MKVLVLVPHPDDEILVAGAAILRAVDNCDDVFVCYSTNGDFEGKPDVRFREAVLALDTCGVDAKNIMTLGYGDTFNGSALHVFDAVVPTTSPDGHSETYAVKTTIDDEEYEFVDFAYQHRGQHSAYTHKNFVQDIKDLILTIRADVIYCVDFDYHADHRALSMGFDEAMDEILNDKANTYHPDVFKKFAYCLALTAEKDFYADNLLATARPTLALESYDFDLIDKFYYKWRERVRFPMPFDCQEPFLLKNALYYAIKEHKSQRLHFNALGIINSDDVFFERRTDSLTHKAYLLSSSGFAERVRDFQFYKVYNVDDAIPHFDNYAWRPEKDDQDRKLEFVWPEPVSFEQIKIYGTLDGCIDKLEIMIDNDSKFIRTIERGGLPTVVKPTCKMPVREVSFRIISGSGDYGISEIEILPKRDSDRNLEPFVKITCDRNFIYDYQIPYRDKDVLKLSVYRFRCDAPVTWELDGCRIMKMTSDDSIILKITEDIAQVRAVVDRDIVDAVEIARVGRPTLMIRRTMQRKEKLQIRWEHHMARREG